MALLDLPAAPPKPGNYDLILIRDGIAYLSGQVSRSPDGDTISGYLGKDADIEEAREAVRVATLRALSVLQDKLGTLDRVERVLTLRGFISAKPDFTRHPEVLDAASEILHATFAERGKHVRTALGVSSIPGGGLAELELVVAVR